jgi:uncharacterized protein (DUF2141 family)
MRHILLAGMISSWILAAQTGPNPASIEGQVVHAGTSAPLKKVSMRLSSGPTNRTVETDEQGRFQFTGLAPGRYSLSAQRAGFLAQNYGARRYNTPGTPIPVSQNQQVRDINLRLTPQGVIVGRVLDEDGDPMAYAQVMVFRQMYRNGRKQWTQANGSSSSDIGEFRVPNLEPGRYLVAAMFRSPESNTGIEESLPEKAEMIYGGTYYPNAPTEQAAAPVDVSAGSETRGIEIHMTKAPGFRIRGTVNGIPRGWAGTTVSLFPADSSWNVVSNTQVQPPGNQFELRGVPSGQYTLTVRMPSDPGQMTASQPVTVASGNLTGIVLTLSPWFDLPAQVSVAETGNTVNLRNVRVSLQPVGLVFRSGNLNVPADANGRLVFNALSSGRFTVNVQDIPDGCFVQHIKYGGQEVTGDGVEIALPALLEVVLSSTAAKISGSVMDKDGKPVSQATVALIPSDAGAKAISVTISVTTDDSGNFTAAHLRAGTYRLLAWQDIEPGAYADPEFRKPFESGATEVTVGPSEQQTAQLHAIEQ